jgi:hypothetical protein
MNNYQDIYAITEEQLATRNDYRFYFVSTGKKDINKMIEYEFVKDIENGPLFNLGFGNYNSATDGLLDEVVSCNDDHYKVFYTVLNTIPRLFLAHTDATILVQGSDSMPQFIERCKANCNRNCGNEECKMAHRRIKIYRNFVDKNFDNLSNDYAFLGSKNVDNFEDAESYQVGEKYISVLVKRKTI